MATVQQTDTSDTSLDGIQKLRLGHHSRHCLGYLMAVYQSFRTIIQASDCGNSLESTNKKYSAVARWIETL